jgi:small subunit ribosomal protein S8|uniref:Small ribosomal subunit protein uS8c n=1 Tax=Drosera rotundifolia TaxID=173423 RepID=A0A140E9X4_DRORT|nr:ribosomal protein S8 [Drosera rotundifolia]AMK97337.1 ribosomal protein S8 [Drosera rotundifolia]
MSKDTIADILTSIRNADMNGKIRVRIACTKISENIVKILLREGFIENTRKHKERNKEFLVVTLQQSLQYIGNRKGRSRKIFNMKQVSRPSLRIYSNYQEIPRVLGGMGIVILSTSRGIMTDREARLQKIGGEILCYIW